MIAVLVFAAWLLGGGHAVAASPACAPGILPDSACTPGAVATRDRAEIVAIVNGLTYTRRHRVWTRQRETAQRYGVPWSRHRDYEDDDRAAVCAGGDNSDPRNHWMQPSDRIAEGGWGYETKDELDAGACRLLKAGTVDVAMAQGWFLAPDWRVGYCAMRAIEGRPDQRCAGLRP